MATERKMSRYYEGFLIDEPQEGFQNAVNNGQVRMALYYLTELLHGYDEKIADLEKQLEKKPTSTRSRKSTKTDDSEGTSESSD